MKTGLLTREEVADYVQAVYKNSLNKTTTKMKKFVVTIFVRAKVGIYISKKSFTICIVYEVGGNFINGSSFHVYHRDKITEDDLKKVSDNIYNQLVKASQVYSKGSAIA